MCMLEYFSYCIPPKQCFLGAFQSQTVATLEGRTAAAAGHVPVLLLNISSTATWSHRELNRTEWKMPLTHLCFFLPCAAFGRRQQSHNHQFSSGLNEPPKKMQLGVERNAKFQVTVFLLGFLMVFYFTPQITLLLLWNLWCCYSWGINQQFTC